MLPQEFSRHCKANAVGLTRSIADTVAAMSSWRTILVVGLACLASAAVAEEEAPRAGDDLGVETVHSTIVSVDRRERGELIFRLTNGQVWVQERVGFVTVNPGERVAITPARLGGVILTTERSAATRVQRLE